MRTPTYSLIKDIDYKETPSSEPISFPGGTLVFVFWQDTWLTESKKEDLKKARGELDSSNPAYWMYPPNNKDYVMCIIGTTWVPVERSNIRRIS